MSDRRHATANPTHPEGLRPDPIGDQVLLDSLSAHIAVLDARGRIIAVNAAWRGFADQNGLATPSYGLGVDYPALCEAATGPSADGAADLAVALRDLLAGRRDGYRAEYPCHDPACQRWFQLRVTRVEHGAVMRLLLVHENITEVKRAMRDVRRSEERFRSMFERHDSVMLLIDAPSGDIIDANAAAERFYGYSRTALRAMTITAINQLPPEDVQARMAAAQQEETNAFVFPHRLAGGEIRRVEVHSTPIEYGDRRLLFSIIHDVTDRERAESALRASENRYRLLAETANDMISRHDTEGAWLYASPACRTLLGYEPDELVGSSAYVLYHPDDVPRIREHHNRVLLRMGTYHAEYRIRRQDGRYIWFETNSQGLVDPESGEVTEIISVSRDVTARKQAQDAHNQRLMEIAHVSRLTTLGELASGLAHELSQPVGAIVNYADATRAEIERGGCDMMQVRADLEHISGQARRASEIISRLRQLVRKGGPRHVEADLNSLVRDMVDLERPECRRRGVRVAMELTPDLPKIRVDVVQIEQAILNLLHNAIEAVTSGDRAAPEVRITTGVVPKGEVEFSVRDNGPGLAGTDLGRVFEPFVTTKPGGLGLGLAISRSIIERHGGRLWAASNRGSGAEFAFSLPARTASAAPSG